jgi:glycerate 2-kinase
MRPPGAGRARRGRRERIAEIAAAAGAGDLVLCLISGGASALLPLPAPPVTLAEKQEVTRLLLACGADIHEINAVRKHLSAIKGGQLARLAWPAAVEALLVSDVIGDILDVIGSGPAAPDPSTFAEAAAVLDRSTAFATRCRQRCASGSSAASAGAIAETPKPGDPLFARVRNTVIGGNRLALDAAARRAAAWVSHAGALELDRGRDARDRAHARRHRARSGGSAAGR